MGESEVPTILSAVLTTLCRDFQLEALQAPDHTEMQLVSILPIVPLEKVVRMGGRVGGARLIQRRKCKSCCTLLMSALVVEDSKKTPKMNRNEIIPIYKGMCTDIASFPL